jgi:hypothetical protein
MHKEMRNMVGKNQTEKALQVLAEDFGYDDITDYILENGHDTLIQGVCVSCHHTDQEIELDGGPCACDNCGQETFISPVKALGMI